MKYLKLFESFEEIDSICRKFGITNWTVNEDGTVDVDGSVNLIHKGLKKLPLNFGKISRGFYCAGNNLTDLKGAPKEIGTQFDFDCSNNKLTSLEGAPNRVGRNFHCYKNELITLEGGPKEVGGHFNCYFNKLTSLEGGPIKVDLNFFCSNNELTSLNGAPMKVGGEFLCNYNPIWEVYKLFPDYKSFLDSMDYNYLRGTNIDRRRFKEALDEVKKRLPKSIPGYKYI